MAAFSSSSSSSRRKPLLNNLHLQPPFSATSAPPPTPSAHPSNPMITTTINDALSNLLQRLPPTHLRSPTTPPIISLSNLTPLLLSAATELGFFHLSHHHLLLPTSAAIDSLFYQKPAIFSNTWPLGYENNNLDDDVGSGESFCLDPSTLGPEWAGVREFGVEMGRVGLKVLEELATVSGFKNPTRDEVCSLLWVSDDEINKPGRVYPYVLGLHCRLECGGAGSRCSLLSDSGWVDVPDQEDSILVTLGDIAQVWSNGKLKKVRGRPMSSSSTEDGITNSRRITLSLLITLPVNSTISPQLQDFANAVHELDVEESEDSPKKTGELSQFCSFSFEDYAWRVYHERILVKDPLVRYRL